MLFVYLFSGRKCFPYKEGELNGVSNIIQKLCPNMPTSYQTF